MKISKNKDEQKIVFDFILKSMIKEFENVNNFSDIKAIQIPINIKKEDKEIEKI
jgi:hypothetical protein